MTTETISSQLLVYRQSTVPAVALFYCMAIAEQTLNLEVQFLSVVMA